jgi:hypothetical protein
MQMSMADEVRPGFDVLARDGSPVGTVLEVSDEELIVRPTGDQAASVAVARNLVVEAGAGRVHVDLAPEDLGLEARGGDDSGPSGDPGTPPNLTTPEYIRRLAGG